MHHAGTIAADRVAVARRGVPSRPAADLTAIRFLFLVAVPRHFCKFEWENLDISSDNTTDQFSFELIIVLNLPPLRTVLRQNSSPPMHSVSTALLMSEQFLPPDGWHCQHRSLAVLRVLMALTVVSSVDCAK